MRLSRVGVKFDKSRGSEESLSQEILFQCHQLKRHSAGIYGLGHFLIRARNKLVRILIEELEKFDCAQVCLPVLQPQNLWKESGRFETFTQNQQMFTFEGRNGACCLAPTGEEIVIDFAKNNIISYKDLPINIFQIGNKYRDEIRVRGGLMRSKEFLMKDGYSFHASFDDMVKEYEKMKKCYLEIFSRLDLDPVVVKAVNANMGGKVSEEFMVFSETGEDKILINPATNMALNVEILESEDALADLKKNNKNFSINDFVKRNCIELAHIFQLGTFYSEKMGGTFTDFDGEKKHYYMGCYGIGVNRVLGAICELFCDSEGLKWPRSIEPYRTAVIYSNELKDKACEVYEYLLENGVETVLFDSEDGFGSKMKNAKLLGFPKVMILGRHFLENGEIEIENRTNSEKCFVGLDGLLGLLKS